MDINEIKVEMDRRKWSPADLAEKIGKNVDYVRKILSGQFKLSKSTEKHIELLFESTRTVFFAFAVDIPDETCRSWVANWDDLTPKAQAKAIKTIVQETLAKLKKIGYENLSDDEREAIANMLPNSPITQLNQ